MRPQSSQLCMEGSVLCKAGSVKRGFENRLEREGSGGELTSFWYDQEKDGGRDEEKKRENRTVEQTDSDGNWNNGVLFRIGQKRLFRSQNVSLHLPRT